MDERKMSRRMFLKGSSLLLGGVVLGQTVGSQQKGEKKVSPSRILNYNPKMTYRRLGKTGLMISEISLGGHWKNREGGRFWGAFADDNVPEDVARNRTEVISKCIELGINYLDITTSAECLAYGVALKGRRDKMFVGADDCILCPRNPANRTVERQIFNVEECLRRLGFDYLDIWRPQADMVHGHTDAEIEVLVEAFEKLHQQGKVRFLGISSHNRHFLQHVIETFPQFSVVIFPYMARSKVKPSELKPGEKPPIEEAPAGSTDFSVSIFESCKKHDVGIITIKPFAGGSLFRSVHARFPIEGTTPPEDHEIARLTLRYILMNKDITATVPGMTTIAEVENNVRASLEARTAAFNDEELRRLHKVTDRLWANLPTEYRWLKDWEWV